MSITDLFIELSQKNKDKKIIYPDISDDRIFTAISELVSQGEKPVICGKTQELQRYEDIDGGEKYIVPDEEDNLIFAAKKVASREVDGMVAGNISTSTDVCRACIKNIGSAEGVKRISSHFLMGKDDHIMLFSDCGLQIDPDAEQLAEIAYLTIQSALKYGMNPRVAMLSYSTLGSGGDTGMSLKVREATRILQERLSSENLTVSVIGEVQFDSAFIPEVGKKKMGDNSLDKPANIFIFPNLDAGNIAYKITQRLARYEAIGPIIQGLARPANDLSRGCSVEDIIKTHYITKNQ